MPAQKTTKESPASTPSTSARRAASPDGAVRRRTGPDVLGDRLRTEVSGAVEEVRRILEGLRPAALDELGLVGALQRRAAQLTPGLDVTVTGPDGPLDLDPAVEAAAHRIADEALTNVVRHAGASACEVEVHLDGVLRMAVTDDEQLFAALRAGARGYLLKGADRAELVRAICSVAAGEAVYGPQVARRIVDFFTGAREAYSAQVFPGLTDREREVLQLPDRTAAALRAREAGLGQGAG